MTWLRHIAMLMLSLSIALAGFPAQAKPECPMAKMMEQMAAQDHGGDKDHDCCPKIKAEKQQKKSGCCDDAACNAKCMGASSVSMTSSGAKTELPSMARQSQRLYPADAALASQHLNTQERPPKSLS
jgi:hypothetical protein